ncbi:MAG: hypothetical protein U0936_22280 [Planctomycetaceae bacterium]
MMLSSRWCLVLGWLCCSLWPTISDAQEPSLAIISVNNAAHLQRISTLPKRASLILRGPERGQLTLLDWNRKVEVVDELSLTSIPVLAAERRPIDIALCPAGDFVVWTERDQTSYTVESFSDRTSIQIEVGDDPGHAAVSPDGKLIAIGQTLWDPKTEGAGSSRMRLYDKSGTVVREFESCEPGALSPVFSPDGKVLAVGNRNGVTRMFEISSGKLLHVMDKEMTHAIAFSPDGTKLAAGYVDGSVALWNVSTGELLNSKPSGCREVLSLDWSPQGDVLATCGHDGKTVLWNTTNLEELWSVDIARVVLQVRFTSDGTRLLSSSATDAYAKEGRMISVWTVPEAVSN